jgi:hypothetical protein
MGYASLWMMRKASHHTAAGPPCYFPAMPSPLRSYQWWIPRDAGPFFVLLDGELDPDTNHILSFHSSDAAAASRAQQAASQLGMTAIVAFRLSTWSWH